MKAHRPLQLAALWMLLVSPSFAATSGNFVAVLNETTSFADSRRAITFFDADNPAIGPLFSVAMPFEIQGTSSNAYEDPSAITVNPTTGDVYILAFDSGSTAGQIDDNGTAGVTTDDDTIADWDVYRLNFKTVFDHWKANFEGKDVRNNPGGPTVQGPAPTLTASDSPTNQKLDYVTYGVTTPYSAAVSVSGIHLSPNGATDQTHSNGFVLAGAIEKVGEVNRNVYTGTSNFVQPQLSFIDQSTLIMIDDARAARNVPANDIAANDNDYRYITRVGTSAGAATSNGIDGGYNLTTTESWESKRIGQVNLDPGTLSEPQAMSYYADSASGIRGVWVTDRDGGGDDIAFLQLDANGNSLGYRPLLFPGAGSSTPAFGMDDDPANMTGVNTGKVDKVFVDSDSGDLIIVESGFGDTPAIEPSIIRLEISSYDNGSGQIALGAFSNKFTLAPTKDTADTFLERGYYSAWDSANDRAFFASPGEGSADPLVNFAADIYMLDVDFTANTAVTNSFLNLDESVSLFLSGSSATTGDKVVYFGLPAAGVVGDYSGNGTVGPEDYTAWKNAFGTATALPNLSPTKVGNIIDASDYTVWRDAVGGSSAVAAATVPEPAAMILLLCGVAGTAGLLRRYS